MCRPLSIVFFEKTALDARSWSLSHRLIFYLLPRCSHLKVPASAAPTLVVVAHFIFRVVLQFSWVLWGPCLSPPGVKVLSMEDIGGTGLGSRLVHLFLRLRDLLLGGLLFRAS